MGLRGRGRSRVCRALLIGTLVATIFACGPSYKRRPVETVPGIEVILRGEKGGEDLVDQGFDHPLTISPVRVTHVLSQIDVREQADEGGERRPAVPTQLLYDVGSAVSKGLSEATPAEEVVVRIQRKERRLGVFSTTYLTSLVIYSRGDRLFVHVRHVDWEVPKTQDDKLPEPWTHSNVSSFRVVPGEAMTLAGPQEVAVDWRDPVFRSPRRIRVGPGGRIERRVILMESLPEDELGAEPVEQQEERGGRLSPEALRELADLEEARLSGEISESQYKARRRAILGENPASR